MHQEQIGRQLLHWHYKHTHELGQVKNRDAEILSREMLYVPAGIKVYALSPLPLHTEGLLVPAVAIEWAHGDGRPANGQVQEMLPFGR